MKTRELLEQDKERLLARLSKADTAEQTVTALEDELSRIQIQYGEHVTDETMSREASYALQTAKAALSLVDSTGDVRTYERTGKPKKGAQSKYLIPLTAGLGATAVGATALTMAPAGFLPLSIIMVIAGICLSFVSGYNFGRRKLLPDEAEQIIEVSMDSDKIYRNLNAMLTVVDHNLEDARLTAMEAAANPAPSPDDVTDDELRLLSSILETAYSSEDSDENRQTISDITFYLYRRGISVMEYSADTAKYFNRMPAARTGTLKPALVKDNVVLIRGMAAVKSNN